MKIAAFYENILEGAERQDISAGEAVKDLMKSGLELLYVSSWVLENRRDELDEVLRTTGVGVEGLHGFFDFGSHPEDESYQGLIQEAVRLNATNVLLVPGMIPQTQMPERDGRIESMIQALKQAVAFGEQHGVAVSMEDFDSIDAPYCTIGGLEHFIQNVPGLKCSFDTGNFIMYSEDEFNAFRHFQDRLCTVHLKDRLREPSYPDDRYKTCADGSKVYACPTGAGYVRIPEILDALVKQGYTGNVIVELYDYSPSHMLEGIRQSVLWTRQYLKGQERTA